MNENSVALFKRVEKYHAVKKLFVPVKQRLKTVDLNLSR